MKSEMQQPFFCHAFRTQPVSRENEIILSCLSTEQIILQPIIICGLLAPHYN